MKTRILVVADDASLRATLARGLLPAGYAIELAESARHARDVMTRESVALVMLAPRNMTAVTELAREIKDKVGRLVLVLESAETVDPVLESLVAPGARVVKPFAAADVLARIKSELGAAPPAPTADEPAAPRRESLPDQPQRLQFEGYILDGEARSCVDAAGREVTLTRAEFALLFAFARQPGRVLTRDELSHVVAGRGAEADDRSVDVLISRLRRKIERDPKMPRIIITMPGEGYKFSARPVALDPSASQMIAPSPAALHKPAADGSPGERAAARIGKTRMLSIVASAIAVVLVAIAGWTAWQMRTVSRQIVEAAAVASTPSSATSAAASTAEQSRRAAVYKRMISAMQDDRFSWRTVERLAIESGVDETEAHEILAEHPDEVVLGKSHDGKLLARLAER